MGQRIDWYDDPDAPAANSVKPSAAAYVVDDDGRVLLIRRDDNRNWSMPGGAMDDDESLVACAVRETLEETGVTVEITGVGGVWTDPLHRVEYTSNGEVRREFTIVYRARATGGTPTTSSESLSVEWVQRDKIAGLEMDRSQRMRLDHLQHTGEPYFDPS